MKTHYLFADSLVSGNQVTDAIDGLKMTNRNELLEK